MAGVENQITPVPSGSGHDEEHEKLPNPVSIHYDEYLEERADHPERVLIANPLRNRTREEVIREARKFRRVHGLRDIISRDVFVRAALAAQNPDAIEEIPGITRLELISLRRERSLSFWGQMKDLTREFIQILTTCCTAAIVQGWDQSSINGANLNWPKQRSDGGLGLYTKDSNGSYDHQSTANVWKFGIVNAATYFSAALIGSQLSDPLNEYAFGRRGALFIAAAFSFATVIACAYVESWEVLLGMRILLGIGIGAKASIVPIYIAETCPTRLRGSLVIFWQMFVACGIFAGDAANLVVLNNWRWQVATPFIPAVPLMVLVFFCYESPRWLYKHNKVRSALNSLRHLRKSDILACRDLFLMHEQLQGEVRFFLRKDDQENHKTVEPPTSAQAMADAGAGESDDDLDLDMEEPDPVHDGQKTPTWGSRIRDLKTLYMPSRRKKPMEDYHIEIRNTTYVQRYRQLFVRPHIRATTAAACVMGAQQLCGVNVLAFLSSTIFLKALGSGDASTNVDAPEKQRSALWMSFGFGVSNFVFTFLAWGTIDKKGRRWLLNFSFPGMALMLLGMSLSFLIPNQHASAKLGAIVTFTILFAIAYSPGVGPVPFTASAEMFPLFIREVGMSFAVFVNLMGAGVIALVTPSLADAMTPSGLLGLFVGLDLIAWLLCYLYYPETARISLEELRAVFDVPLSAQARYRVLWLKCAFKAYTLAKWTKEYVEFPDPMHVWWRDQPKSEEEKKEHKALEKNRKWVWKERLTQERRERKQAKQARREGEGRGRGDEEWRTMEAELEQLRKENQELKMARTDTRQDSEAV